MLPRCIIAFVLGFVFKTSLSAQDSLLHKQITIQPVKCSIEQALKVIEQHTGLSFSYNTGLIDKKKETILEADGEPLIDLLKRLFDDSSLQFTVIGNHIAVYRIYSAPSADPFEPDSVTYFRINGKVFDKETRQPLSFSSVYLIGRTLGTISNEEGEFSIKLSSSEVSETLGISCIGYKNYTAPVSSLINSSRNYYLEADVIPIQEVIIRKISPLMILEEANKRIKDNYSTDPAILTCFYRETIQRGSRFTMVSEAVLENFKAGYRSYNPDRVKIVKGRKNEDFSRNDSLILKLKAGLNTMLLLDVVKNIPDFLTGESLLDYRYRLADIVVEDDRDHYAVEFAPMENSPEKSFYSGRIIVDIEDMAFRWIEFQVEQGDLDIATQQFIVRKPANVIAKTLKATYKVAYRKHNGKYYLHMIICETGFRIRNRGQFSGAVYNTKLETVVTQIDTVNVSRFPLRESARPSEFFTEQLGSYDESFWGRYNFITPEESLENALKRLKEN